MLSTDASTAVVSVEGLYVPDGWMGLDIGPESAARFAQLIEESETVVEWANGVFEMAPFAAGTRAVGENTDPRRRNVSGRWGDSAASCALLGIDENLISHISTGGGASLRVPRGRTLPGLTVPAKS